MFLHTRVDGRVCFEW